MRIAYVINSVEGGGAAAPVPAITRVLRDQGAEVRVFALARRDGRALPAMEEAGLEPLVRPGGKHDHVAALRWLARETWAWGATHLWTSLTRATMLGLLLARRRGLPAICWQHAAFLKTGNRLMLRALQSTGAAVGRRFDLRGHADAGTPEGIRRAPAHLAHLRGRPGGARSHAMAGAANRCASAVSAGCIRSRAMTCWSRRWRNCAAAGLQPAGAPSN